MSQWKSFLRFLLYGEGRGPLGLWHGVGQGDRFVGDKTWKMTTEKCWPPESDGFVGAPGPDATKMFAISRTFHHKPVMMFTWVLSDGWGGQGVGAHSSHCSRGRAFQQGVVCQVKLRQWTQNPSSSAGLSSQMGQARCPSRGPGGPAVLDYEHLPVLDSTLGVRLGMPRGHMKWLHLL